MPRPGLKIARALQCGCYRRSLAFGTYRVGPANAPQAENVAAGANALGVRRSMRGRNTRQRILDATQRLIEKDGFARLTTNEIAQEADCAEGTIFKHFKSKDNLCLAVVLENAPRFKEV